MRGAIPPRLNSPSWRGAQLKHRDNFTFNFTFPTEVYEGLSKSFRTESIMKFTLTFGVTREAKLTRLTLKITMQLPTSGRELYHLQFSLQAASPETWMHPLIFCVIHQFLFLYGELSLTSMIKLVSTFMSSSVCIGLIGININSFANFYCSCEADHSPPSSAEVKNARSYTSTPPVRLHGVVRS
jgi:hypothetical protein